MKRNLKAISRLLLICLLALLAMSGCSKKERVIHYGMPGSPSAIYGNVREICITSDYLADAAEAIGLDTMRVVFRLNTLFKVDKASDKITFKNEVYNMLREHVDKIKSKGVTRIIAMTDNYLYPYDYGHSVLMCVPDPLLETDYYIRWLNLQAEAFKMIATAFPEVHFFEPTNEPDHPNSGSLNKNGYTYRGENNGDFIWTDEEAGYILADMCWYISRAVKSVNSKNQVLLPGLTALMSSPDYLQCIYDAIASQTLPTGMEYADIDPDNYFDILNWHPYILSSGCSKIDEWVQFQRDFYAVAQRNGDKDKSVWFTEMGFSDSGLGERKEEETAANLTKILQLTQELEFVDTFIIYCLSDFYDTPVSAAEDNFGMVESLANPLNIGKIKPIGKAYFHFINGADADITPFENAVQKNLAAFRG